MLEAVSSLFWEMLHHACLSGFASCAQMLYPPPILVLPITLNLTFLIVCSSWHLAVSHLPALKEAGCCLSVCLSVPKTLIKQLSARPVAGLFPAAAQPGLADGHSLWQGWPGPACVNLEEPRCATPQLLPHLSFQEVGWISSWDAISFIFQKLLEVWLSPDSPLESFGFEDSLSIPTKRSLFSIWACSDRKSLDEVGHAQCQEPVLQIQHFVCLERLPQLWVPTERINIKPLIRVKTKFQKIHMTV